MNTKEMLKRMVVSEESIDAELLAIFGTTKTEDGGPEGVASFEADTILKGRVIDIINDEVIVDVGYKSEGVISKSEFENPEEIDIGDEVEVLLDGVEDETGQIQLSKRKADRLRGWERVIQTNKEGDTVRGKVMRKIKGGLVVDIGVPPTLVSSSTTVML